MGLAQQDRLGQQYQIARFCVYLVFLCFLSFLLHDTLIILIFVGLPPFESRRNLRTTWNFFLLQRKNTLTRYSVNWTKNNLTPFWGKFSTETHYLSLICPLANFSWIFLIFHTEHKNNTKTFFYFFPY